MLQSVKAQVVLVALARAGMIVISKHLLEMIITKREYLRKQKENTEKQKGLELDDKLKVMQNLQTNNLMIRLVEKLTRMSIEL